MGWVKLLGHAARPSMGRLGADTAQAALSTGSRSHLVPVGSQSQWVLPVARRSVSNDLVELGS